MVAAILMRQAKRWSWYSVLAFGPPMAFVLLFMLYPYINVFLFSLYQVDGYAILREPTAKNYVGIFTTPLYRASMRHSVEIALIVTFFSVSLAYLLAYYIVFLAHTRRIVLYFLVVVPLWTSFLLRVYVWKLILGRTGLINGALMSVGLIDEPISALLYNRFSVCLTLTYILLPFAFLPIYTALEKIHPAYIEASLDLGGSPATTLWRVILPLSMPGVIAGATFTFCLSFGDFVTPSLVGGPEGVMISNIIIHQFGTAFDWPFGSALAVVVLLGVLTVISLAAFAERKKPVVI